MGTRRNLKRAFSSLAAGSLVGVLVAVLPSRRGRRLESDAGLAAFATAPCAERSAEEIEQELERARGLPGTPGR